MIAPAPMPVKNCPSPGCGQYVPESFMPGQVNTFLYSYAQ